MPSVISQIISDLALYFTIWWVVLFVTLPLNIQRDPAPKPGHDHGAPLKPELKKKFLVTTGIAFVVWLLLRQYLNSEHFLKVIGYEV